MINYGVNIENKKKKKNCYDDFFADHIVLLCLHQLKIKNEGSPSSCI